MKVLLAVLKYIRKALMKWPNDAEINTSPKLLVDKREYGYLFDGLFGVVDGRRWVCADFTDVDTQNTYYQGFTSKDKETNLFVFDFNGNVINAANN